MSPVHSRLWVRIMREHDRSAGNRSWRFRHVNSTRGLALVATVLTVVTLLTGATAQAAASVRLVPFETRRRTGRFCGATSTFSRPAAGGDGAPVELLLEHDQGSW